MAYTVVDVDEIKSTEYHKAQNDTKFVQEKRPLGFVHSRGADRTLYLSINGKYYAGAIDNEVNVPELMRMAFNGISITTRAIFQPKTPVTSSNIQKIKEGVKA